MALMLQIYEDFSKSDNYQLHYSQALIVSAVSEQGRSNFKCLLTAQCGLLVITNINDG